MTTENEEFEFRLRAERERGAPAEAPTPSASPAAPSRPPRALTRDNPGAIDDFLIGALSRAPGIGNAPNIQGSIPGRLIQGAADLPIGALQLAANVVGAGNPVNERIAAIEERTNQLRGPNAGFDWARLTGNLATPGGLVKALKIPLAATTPGKVLQGIGFGTTTGLSTPVTDGGEDFAKQKALQAGVGGLVGGLFPVGSSVAGGAYRAARDTLDLVLPGGASRIANRYTQKIVGPENMDAVVDAAKTAKELVPGSRPTMAQAVAGLPEGSPIQAHQKIVAGTAGGPSAKFGQRALDQKAARVAAAEARDVATGPMRETALDSANLGGVMADDALAGIDRMLSQPGQRASDVVQKTLGSIKEKVAGLTDERGVINARDLYTIRKELGNTIQTHAKETANWDKRLTSGLERDIQKSFDDAIESAGGKGWKDYLSTYASASKGIREDIDRARRAMKPEQRTVLGGGVNVAEETRTHLPNLLSRPAMIANAVLRYAGAGVEPRVDKIMSERYLNPEKFSEAMKGIPFAQRKAVLDEIERQIGLAAAGGAARGAESK